MHKHRKLLITLVCLAVVAVVVGVYVFVTHETEPHYQGRSLSELLTTYYSSSTERSSLEALHALNEIGTNAIPCLLQWIRSEPYAWQAPARSQMSPKLSKSDIGSWVFGLQEEGRAIEAILAFGLLGTNAAPAVPQLAAMMNTRSQPGLVQRSIAALAAIGPPAHSALAQALSDTNFSERVEILIEIQIHTTNLSGSSPLRPVLQRLVLDPDSMVRDGARSALRQMAPELLTDNPAK